MTSPRVKIAQLDEARIAKLRALENELGSYLVALEPKIRLAELAEQQVKRLQAAEEELGVVLLAYEK